MDVNSSSGPRSRWIIENDNRCAQTDRYQGLHVSCVGESGVK